MSETPKRRMWVHNLLLAASTIVTVAAFTILPKVHAWNGCFDFTSCYAIGIGNGYCGYYTATNQCGCFNSALFMPRSSCQSGG